MYNKKNFLAPDSRHSMAAYHAFIDNASIAKLRISDCQHAILLWNDLTKPKQVEEMLEKLKSLREGILGFEEYIKLKYVRT